MSDEDLLKAYRELGDQNYTVQLTDDGRDSSYSTIAFSLSWPDDRPEFVFWTRQHSLQKRRADRICGLSTK